MPLNFDDPTISKPGYMQLQVNPGPLYIKKSNDEYGGGDEPAWSLFRGRLRIDGNSHGNSGFTISQPIPRLKRTGENLQAGAINDPLTSIGGALNWYTSSVGDWGLKVFDPKQIFQSHPTAPNLEADIAIGGVVYWEVDNNMKEVTDPLGMAFSYYKEDAATDTGVDSRREFVDIMLNCMGGSANRFTESLVIPFDYKSYFNAPKGSLAKWGQSLGAGLSGALTKLAGDASTAVVGILKERFNDYIAHLIFGRSDVDQITGIHLMALIPVTPEFYSNLQLLKRSHKLPGDPFPNDELITTIKMFDPAAYNRTSTWLTFGFVPNGHPATLPAHTAAYSSGPESGFFKKTLGTNKEMLSFRGGYDSALHQGRGWTTQNQEWTASAPGIKAGGHIFSQNPDFMPNLAMSV